LNLFVIVIALAIALSGFGLARLKARTAVSRQAGGPVTSARIGSLSQQEVEKLLARIEKTEEPDYVMGAMCYEPVAQPDVAEYVCPACGEKTIYSDGLTWTVQYDIPEARMLFQQLIQATRLRMELDESSFCRFCTPDLGGLPGLLLTIEWEDGTRTTSAVTNEDLRMLIGLFEGELSYTTANDASIPLGQSIERLRELLGLNGE